MNKFLEYIAQYRAGTISAFDLYQKFPPEMQKSIDGFIGGGAPVELKKSAKSLTAPEGEDEGEEVTAENIQTKKHGTMDGDEKTMKKNTGMYGAGGATGAVQVNAPPPLLNKSLKAQENRMSSRYGTETIRKSSVGSRCVQCERLHKSVGNICESCTDARSNVRWHQSSHLE